jgi:hypothetical protein
MEPEGSLPHSQEPATCSFPEPDQSCPYPYIPLLEDKSVLGPDILLSTLLSKHLNLCESITVTDQVEGTEQINK